MLLFKCLYVLLFLLCVSSKEVEESNTGALLRFPFSVDGQLLYNQTWEVAPAQFGYHKYGGKLTGWLVIPLNTTYHTECHGGEPKYKGTGEDQEIANPYIHYLEEFFLEEDFTDYIFVIDRLDCYFVDKVEAAEALGAAGVIVCDKKKEHLFTMWMPSDWDDDISIPSVLLQEEHCEVLMEHLGVVDWDPYNPEYMIYPTAYTFNWTIAELEWGLPHDDDRVEWELWTSSNDEQGTEFKHHFENTSKALDAANYTVFTPHMYTLDGSHWNCDNVLLPCKKQCTNSGRYCSVDPEFDLTIGLDGVDVIRENLRSLCVWKYDKEHFAENNDIVWWDYFVAWYEHCGILTPDGVANFTAECAWRQMDKFNANLTDYVQKCVDDSGGYGYKDGVNTILQREMNLKKNHSVYAMPMVRVNEFMIHGNIDCPLPITVQSCEVLAAICAGFINGTAPDVCDVTPAPTPCPTAEEDCAHVCFGLHQYDACNKCLLLDDPRWDECIGCDGIINATYDCNGVCEGDYKENPCGYCINSTRSDFDTYMQDCAGGCSTNMQWDKCNKCRDISSEEFNSCLGCDNVPHSGKEYNDCGLCLVKNGSVSFENEGKDCNNTCFGSRVIDECGVCLLEADPQWNACLGCNDTYDCNGVCGGHYQINPCGYCINSSRDDFDEYMTDCAGGCSTTVTRDRCGQCLESSADDRNACVGCDNIVNSTKILNPCGLCLLADTPNFEEEGVDCAGDCFGQHYIDDCGVCLYYEDEEWNACMNDEPSNTTANSNTNGGDTGSDGGSNNNDKLWSQFTIIIVVIVVVACGIILCAAMVISKMWRKQKNMNKDLRQIRETYIPMDDEKPKKSGFRSGKKKGMTSVPDDESDGEDFTVQ